MARVTVEDCIDVVPNQFELILLSAQLAREVNLGAHQDSVRLMQKARTSRYSEKPAVLALRVIAAREESIERLESAIISGMLPLPLAAGAPSRSAFGTADPFAPSTSGQGFDPDAGQPGLDAFGPIGMPSGTERKPLFEDIEEEPAVDIFNVVPETKSVSVEILTIQTDVPVVDKEQTVVADSETVELKPDTD